MNSEEKFFNLNIYFIKPQDSSIVFSSIATGDIGFHLAKAFLVDRIEEIHSLYVSVRHMINRQFVYKFIFSLEPDTSRLARYIKPLANQMTSQKEYDELQSFVRGRATIFEDATQSIKQSLETVKINSQWQASNYKSIGRILNEFSSE